MQVQDTVRPILPPPPSSTKRGHLERQHTVPVPPVSTTSSPATTSVSKTPPPESTIHWFDRETENLFNDSELTNLNKNSTTKKEEDVSVNLCVSFVLLSRSILSKVHTMHIFHIIELDGNYTPQHSDKEPADRRVHGAGSSRDRSDQALCG